MEEKIMSIKVDNNLIQRLKGEVIDRKLKLDFQRTDILSEVYKEYEGQPQILIRARFLERLLLEKKIYIDDYLFVGNLAGEFGAFYLYPEWNNSWIKNEDTFPIPEEKKEQIDELFEYWSTRNVTTRSAQTYEEIYGEKYEKYTKSGFLTDGTSAPAGVSTLNYERALREGLESFIAEAEDRLSKLELNSDNQEKFYFYKAVIIELKAVVAYANRYADLAEELAAKETDPEKKQKYLDIVEVTRRVPAKGARNFREALQAHLFLHTTAQLEQVGCGYASGYLGQVFEPYYQKDKAEGNITAEEATYLLKHHFLKLNDISYYYGRDYDIMNSGDTAQTISIGGLNADGQDATGEVDYLILDAQQDLRLPQPPIALIYHDKLKPAFVQKAVDLVKTGIGMPQFMNANVLVERSLDAYARYGATIREARRTCVCGCVSTAIESRTAYIMGPTVNLAKPVELALYNGVDPTTGIQVGPETGDPASFDTFEKFYQAYKTHLFSGIKAARRHEKVNNFLYSEFLQVPYRSALIQGSLEKGRDIWHGGSLYTATATTYNAGVDAANSLLAIRELIYNKKALTFAELKEALEADFEGHELVQKLLFNVPKHGNNVAEDEELVSRVYKDAFDAFQAEGNNYVGQYGKPDAYSKSFHNYFGRLTGALPTGKKKGVALTDGSVSAQPGTDVNGPTALVSSAATAVDTVAYNSTHLNVKVNPNTLKTENGASALVSLIDGFVNQGGNHIQFNCVDAETLKDAKLHPENHKDLVVRVAGFSAYFTKLHEGIQDELIARTEHDLAV